MNKRYERNHFKAFSNSVNHKKMYKKGKNWIVGSLTLLALAGLGVTADHSVHADADVNTKASTTSVGSTSDIEHQAKAMYNGMIAHSMTTPAQGKAKLVNNGKPSVTSGASTSSSSAASGSAAKATQSISQPTNNKDANQAKPAVHFGGFGATRELGTAKLAPDVSPDPYNAADDVAAIAKENTIMNSEAPKAEAGNIPYFREDFQDKFGNDSQGFVAASEALSNDYANYKSMLGSNPSTATTAYVASDYNSAKSYFDDAQTQYSDIFPAPNFNPNEYDKLIFVYDWTDSNGNRHSDIVGTHTFNQKSPGNKLGSDTDYALMNYLSAYGENRAKDHWDYMPYGYKAIADGENDTSDGTWHELNELISRWTQMNGQANQNDDAFTNGNGIQFVLNVEPYPLQRSHFEIQYYPLGTDPNNPQNIVGSDLLGGKPGGICGSIDSDMMFPNGSYVKSLRDNSTSPKGVPEGYTLAPGVASELIDAYADNPREAYQLEHFPSGKGETAVLPLPVVRATTNTVYWVYTNPKTHQKTYTVAINDAETDSDVKSNYTDDNFIESPIGFAVTDGPNFTSKDYQLMNLPSGFIPSDVNSVAPSIMNFVQYFNPSGASKKLYINIEKQATDTVNYVYNGQVVSVNNKPATHIFSGTSDKKDNDLTNYYNNKVQGKWSDAPQGYQVTSSDKASFYQQMANYYKTTNGLYDDYTINIPLTKPEMKPESASAAETTYYYWNNGKSNVSSASTINTYDYSLSASYDSKANSNTYKWSQTSHSASQAQISNSSNYHLIGSFGNLPNSSALVNDLIANNGVSYANYMIYAPDSICQTHDYAMAKDTVNYLINGTSSAVSPTSVSVQLYSRADVNNHTTNQSSVSDWRTNDQFNNVNVPKYIVSNDVIYTESSANTTLPNNNQVTSQLNSNHTANFVNDVYYAPVTTGTVPIRNLHPQPTQSDGIITINYVASDFHPIATARPISGPVNSTVNLQDPQYQQTIDGYNPVGLSSDQATYRDYPQNVYVVYKPSTIVSNDGHIHVRYVDDTKGQEEFFSDKYSDEPGNRFDLAWDDYANRNIPGYHFDGNVEGQVSAYGRDSKFDPHMIIVGYTKDPSDPIINVHQTSYANDLINYVEDSNGHLTILGSSTESIPFSGNATVNKDTGQFSPATSWSAEGQFSSAANLTFPGLSYYRTTGSIPANASVGGRYIEDLYYRPTPQRRRSKPVYIPKQGNGRKLRRRMIHQIKRLKKIVNRDITVLQHRTINGVSVHELHETNLTRRDLIKNEGRLVKLEKANKLPQTGEAHSYSALYAMLFVISAVIMADLGRAIDRRRHE